MIGARTMVALAVLLLATPALAQPRPSDKDKQAAGEMVKKAIAKSQAGDHAAAIEIYQQAYKLVPNAILLSNIGAEFEQSGKPADALRYFCMYLDKDPTGTNAPFATSRARALQIELGNKIVDDDVCAAPRPEPRRKEPPPDPEPRRKEPPPERPERTDRPGRDDRDGAPVVARGGNNSMMYAALATGIAGIAAVGVGAYTGIRADSISNEISTHDKDVQWPDGIRDLEKRGQTYENIQIGSLIAGGVLVTTGVILYVVSRPDPTENRDKITVAPTTNGFVVFGRF